MEGSQWFRLGVIVALFIGSFYVLLPTILQVDPTSALERQREVAADAGPQTGSATEARRFRLDVVEGDPDELAPAVAARLDAAGIPNEGVEVDEDQVIIRRDVTVSDEAMLEALAPAPTLRLHPLAVSLPEGDDAPTSASALASVDTVAALDGEPVTAPPLDITPVRAAGATLTLSAPPPEGTGPLVLTVDGAARAVVLPDEAPEPAEGATDTDAPPARPDTARWASLGDYDRLAADLRLTPLPGTVEPADDAGPLIDDDASAAAEEAESVLPAWLLDIIPDTRMPLGLDLQGGIDLTIQVELDEALLSQANRDMVYLEERAEEKGLEITSVRRNRFDPIIEVDSPSGADAVQGFFGESLGGQYEYLDSVTEGGTTWHRFAMTATRADELRDQSVTQILDVLRKRVAETKVRDPVVVRKGGGKISVQLPGLTDSKTAVTAISKTAVLEFRLVDPDFRRDEIRRLLDEADERMLPEFYRDDQLLNEWLHEEGMLPENRLILFEYESQRDEESGEVVRQRGFAYPVERSVVLTGQDVNGADVQFDPQTQRPAVGMEFKPAGASVFCDFTGEHVDDRFAIILDGEVQSAPTINERICGGRAQITMGQTVDAQEQAKALAVVLRTGSLNAPVSIGSVRQIGPSLGRDAIQAGSIATVGGGLVVLVFMALWYKGPGLIANVALVLNILLMLAGLSLFGWTLTLPGIAGIALTIGMAVDANIIIYERIREELKMGQHARKAVETGFKKAAVAVLDANITTAIAGVVLFSYGNVTIQGFAVTLLMGIGTTLLTALFVTRSLLEIVTRRTTSRLRI